MKLISLSVVSQPKITIMKCRLILILFLLAFFSCQDDKLTNEGKETDPEVIANDSKNYYKGYVRIKLKEQAGASVQLSSVNGQARMGISKIDEIAAQVGATKIERVFPYAGKFEARSRKAGLHLWYDVYFDENIPVTRAISDFSQIPDIEFADPVRKVKRVGGKAVAVPAEILKQTAITLNSEAPFNDPDLSAQWHYNNEGNLPNSVAGADINLFRAWQVTTGSREVIVAIVDGGIDLTHEDLADNIWVNEDESAGYGDNDNNGYIGDINGWNFVSDNPTIIAHSHGTHVAGTVGAVNNNGKGVCGVAGGNGTQNGVRLMSCQIFEHSTENPEKDKGTNKIPAAIKYGADNGAVISQNSWSFTFDEGVTPTFDRATKAAIDYFIENAGKDEYGNQVGPMNGGIVIFAAGNEDKDYDVYPAMYEKVISVASMTPDFTKAYYSNYADWVDITAPGGSYKYGAKYNGKCPVYSTLPDNQYGYMQGTSMACPHVSGVAALIVSRFGVGHPGLTPEEVKARLLGSTKDIDVYNPYYAGKMGVGYMDAAGALQVDEGIAPEPVTDLQVTWKSNSAVLNWSVTRDEDNGVPEKYYIYWSSQSLNNIDFEHLPAAVKSVAVEVGNKQAGDEMTYTISGLDAETPYYVAILGADVFGNRSSAAFENGETISNEAPIVIGRTTGDIILKAHETKEVIFDVTEPEGQSYTFKLEDPSGATSVIQKGESLAVTISAPKAKAGEHNAVLTVTDEPGASTVVEIPYTVLENHAPTLTAASLEKLYFNRIGSTQTLNLKDYFADSDGEVLKYTVTSSIDGYIEATVNEEQLTLKALKAGMATITIQASDYFDKSVSRSFTMMARDGSQEVDLYPNPVIDKLNIRMGEEVDGEVHVKLYSSAGALALEDDVQVEPFKPGVLDVSKLSGGSYVIVLEYGGKEIKKNIIKL